MPPSLRVYRKAAVSAIIGAAFGAAGQRCMAISVAVLVGDAGGWAKDIAEGAAELKVSNSRDGRWCGVVWCHVVWCGVVWSV